MAKFRLLLHLCCAPCGASVAEILNQNFLVTGFFYNPNIQPQTEYQKRLIEIKKFFEKNNLPLISGFYGVERWLKTVKGLEQESEGGQRCRFCYRMRLEETARLAVSQNFDYFATTLTISPHKKAVIINAIGQELADDYKIKFYQADFKKKDGFKRANELAREEGFYRQNYCGCLFSKNRIS